MKLVAIVDSYSSASKYPAYWKNLGVDCIHIQSDKNLPSYYLSAFDQSKFKACLVFDSIEETVKLLRDMQVDFIHAGTETGVTLAEELAFRMGIPANENTNIQARRNKLEMWDALARSSIDVGWSFRISKSEDLNSLLSERSFPVVCKPPESAGGDSVFICWDSNQCFEAINSILGKVNKLGSLNKYAIVQEYLDGDEYAANFVSHKGKHFCTNIWKYHKRQVDEKYIIYDYEELVDPSSSIADQIIKYIKECLTALGVKESPSHCELKITSNGLRLVEIAARLDGICNPNFDSKCVSDSQIELFTESVFFNKLTNKSSKVDRYDRLNFASNVEMISNREGLVKQLNSHLLNDIESFVDVRWFLSEGDQISKTKDLFTSPGIVFLANANSESLNRDILKVRQLEENGLIKIV